MRSNPDPGSRKLAGVSRLAAVFLLLVSGCDESSVQPVASELEGVSVSMHGSATITQHADLFDLPAFTTDMGDAWIKRNKNGVRFQIRVTDPGLQAELANSAVTVWLISWSLPENCTSGVCGDDDQDFTPEQNTGVGVMRAAGNWGNGTFAGHVREGDDSEVILGGPLEDALADELHLVLRDHDDPGPGQRDDEIHMFGTGVDLAAAVFLQP